MRPKQNYYEWPGYIFTLVFFKMLMLEYDIKYMCENESF